MICDNETLLAVNLKIYALSHRVFLADFLDRSITIKGNDRWTLNFPCDSKMAHFGLLP